MNLIIIEHLDEVIGIFKANSILPCLLYHKGNHQKLWMKDVAILKHEFLFGANQKWCLLTQDVIGLPHHLYYILIGHAACLYIFVPSSAFLNLALRVVSWHLCLPWPHIAQYWPLPLQTTTIWICLKPFSSSSQTSTTLPHVPTNPRGMWQIKASALLWIFLKNKNVCMHVYMPLYENAYWYIKIYMYGRNYKYRNISRNSYLLW